MESSGAFCLLPTDCRKREARRRARRGRNRCMRSPRAERTGHLGPARARRPRRTWPRRGRSRFEAHGHAKGSPRRSANVVCSRLEKSVVVAGELGAVLAEWRGDLGVEACLPPCARVVVLDLEAERPGPVPRTSASQSPSARRRVKTARVYGRAGRRQRVEEEPERSLRRPHPGDRHVQGIDSVSVSATRLGEPPPQSAPANHASNARSALVELGVVQRLAKKNARLHGVRRLDRGEEGILGPSSGTRMQRRDGDDICGSVPYDRPGRTGCPPDG